LLEHSLDRNDQFLSQYLSLAVGFVWSKFEDQLAGDNYLQDGHDGRASGHNTSKGFLVRVTPLNSTSQGGLMDNGVFGLKGGAAYGMSLINDSCEFIHHLDASHGDPYPRTYLRGWSANFELNWADNFSRGNQDKFLKLLLGIVDPLFSFTYADQVSEPGYVWSGNGYVYQRDTSGFHEEIGNGWEMGFGNVYYVRQGHSKAEYGDIDGDTEGWGLNLQLGRLGGYRYDWARVPQARGLPSVEREGWSIWVDPVAIVEFLKE